MKHDLARDKERVTRRCLVVEESDNTTGSSVFTPLYWRDDAVWILDQTLLPKEETWLRCREPQMVADAIRRLSIRGAPAIGVPPRLASSSESSTVDRRTSPQLPICWSRLDQPPSTSSGRSIRGAPSRPRRRPASSKRRFWRGPRSSIARTSRPTAASASTALPFFRAATAPSPIAMLARSRPRASEPRLVSSKRRTPPVLSPRSGWTRPGPSSRERASPPGSSHASASPISWSPTTASVPS